MHRRSFLAVATAGLSVVTAGCNFAGETRTLASPEEELDARGREKHLVFRDDDRQVAVVTIAQHTVPEMPTDPFTLRLHLWHDGDEDRTENPTTVENVRFDLRTPSGPTQASAEVYLKIPRSSFSERIELGRTEHGWTRIAADDPGRYGESTINVETIISPVGEPVEELRLRAAAELSEPGLMGTEFQLDANTRFSPIVHDPEGRKSARTVVNRHQIQ